MKTLKPFLLIFMALTLAACAPTPQRGTLEEGAFTASAETLILSAPQGIHEGAAEIRAMGRVESDYCVIPSCESDADGYVAFLFDGQGATTLRLADVSQVNVIEGFASFNVGIERAPRYFELSLP